MRIPFLNVEVLSKTGVDKFNQKAFFKRFGFNELYPGESSGRPPLTYPESFSQDDGIKIPIFPIHYFQMYDASRYSDVMVTVISALKKEILRNGIDKRKISDTELDDETPSENEEETVEDLLTKSVNDNNQKLIDVCDAVEGDLEIADIGYFISLKDYIRDPKGEIVSSTPRELLRGNPIMMRVISDRAGRPGRNGDGVPMWTCVDHRGEASADDERPVCGMDGLLMHRTYYVANNDSGYGHGPGTSPLGAGGRVYYIEDEVMHQTKYEKNFTYGSPKIIAAWPSIQILGSMSNLIRNAYENQRFPRRMIMAATRNQEGMEKSIQATIERIKNNPEMPPFMLIPTDKKGKFAEVLDMMSTPEEMQFTEMRNELRRNVGAMWGVMPLYSADMSQGGGLNNEGLQVTVTVRAAEMGQKIFNDAFFPWILRQYGVEDWEIFLKPTEEKDEMAELQRDALMLNNAQQAMSLGIDVKRVEAEDNKLMFEYGEIVNPPSFQTGQEGENSDLEGDQQESKPAFDASGDDQRFQGEPENVRRVYELTKAMTAKPLKKGQKYKPLPEFKKTDELSFDTIFTKTFEQVEKETGNVLKRDTLSRDLRTAIKNNMFNRKFSGFSELNSKRIRNKLLEALEKKESLEQVIKSLRSVVSGMSREQAENIIRTEQTAIVNTSREFGFKQLDPKGTRVYKWASISDNRRTHICENITRRTEKGVPLEELKSIIREESRKSMPSGWEVREWVSHPQCRSVVVRAF